MDYLKLGYLINDSSRRKKVGILRLPVYAVAIVDDCTQISQADGIITVRPPEQQRLFEFPRPNYWAKQLRIGFNFANTTACSFALASSLVSAFPTLTLA